MTPFRLGKLELKTKQPVLGEPIEVRMTITNQANQAVVIANPEVGNPPADLHWPASNEAYQIGVLLSFRLIQITLTEAAGTQVESKGLMPWVTPLLGKRTLQPQESLALDFDLNELFSLKHGGRYHLQVRYGDADIHVDATMEINIMPRSNISGAEKERQK